MRHVPVLLDEVIRSLQLTAGAHVIDCTVGDGGHSEKILEAIGPKGTVLAIDADPESLLRAKQYLYQYADRVVFVRNNFADLSKIVAQEGFPPADAILIDLGWSSPQFAERGRGFSFLTDEPLDMRYEGGAKESTLVTAAEILRTYTQEELEKIFLDFGEESLAKEIAVAIVTSRQHKAIERTGELVEIILQTYRTKLKTTKEIPWIGGLHPATKIFQALRITVNHELTVIERVMPQALAALAPGGRLGIITFHSLEDRLVKHYFKSVAANGYTIITKKPIVCSESEAVHNTRARSAKLRVIEKKV